MMIRQKGSWSVFRIGFILALGGLIQGSDAATISGTIIDSTTRAGVAGADVYAYIRSYIPTLWGGESLLSTEYTTVGIDSTDAAGAYSITGDILPDLLFPSYPEYQYRHELIVEVTRERYGTPAAKRTWPFPVYGNVTANFTILTMTYGQNSVCFQGIVLDKLSGTPMPGVDVRLCELDWQGYGYGYRRINYWITGVDGKFAFRADTGYNKDAFSLQATKKGYSARDTIIATASFRPFRFPYNCTLRVERAFATITGTVCDSLTRALLSGARMYLRELVYSTIKPDSSVGYYTRDSMTTGSGGAFRFDSVRLFRKYNVVAIRPGYAQDSFYVNADQQYPNNPVFTQAIDLRPSLASFSGTLYEHTTRHPVKQATVYLMGDTFRKLGNIWIRRDTIYDSALTGVNGRYLIDRIADSILYFVNVRAPGFHDWKGVDLTFEGGFRKYLDLPLVMHTGFGGRVTDSATGLTLPYSIVVLRSSMLIPGNPPRFITITLDSMITDTNGLYAFPLDYAGSATMPLSVNASKTGYAAKSVSVRVEDSTVLSIPMPLKSLSTRAGDATNAARGSGVRMVRNTIIAVHAGPAVIALYDMRGRLLVEKHFVNQLRLDVTPWPASTLICVMEARGARTIRRFTGAR